MESLGGRSRLARLLGQVRHAEALALERGFVEERPRALVVVAEQHLAREQPGAGGFERTVELSPCLLRSSSPSINLFRSSLAG